MAPPYRPAHIGSPLCRYPGCVAFVFFDRRVNELREWCSDEHMMAAITHRLERPCLVCRVWPRRLGSRTCSSRGCRYQGVFSSPNR